MDFFLRKQLMGSSDKLPVPGISGLSKATRFFHMKRVLQGRCNMLLNIFVIFELQMFLKCLLRKQNSSIRPQL